jgi:hypothetical protein
LPQSNAILFTIRTYQWPLEDIKQHPSEALGLKMAIENLIPDMRTYKCIIFFCEICVGVVAIVVVIIISIIIGFADFAHLLIA